MLDVGRFLYVDDLVALPEARRRGYGKTATRLAGRRGRNDSAASSSTSTRVSGPTRTDAHRLYFNTGLEITSFHFARDALAQLASARSASPSRT